MTEKKLHILIADDHPIFRKGLKNVIENENRISSVVEEAEDGLRALELLERDQFDLTILDIEMPGSNGIDVVRKMKKNRINCPVIFLTMYDDKELFNEALELGVTGYVLKENAASDIIHAINAVTSGKPYISAFMSSAMLSRKSQAEHLNKQLPSINSLTETERNILKLIANGKTSKQIAGEMYLSPKTINNHRNNIASKLNIHGTHNLLKFAVQHKDEL